MTLTHATPRDAPAIAVLLEQLDRFYGATNEDATIERVSGIENALFADPPAAYALLAWEGDRLVGIAAYSFTWPAVGVTVSMLLKELYVVADRRGGGVGREVMAELLRIAAERGCSRLEWTADANNPGAQRFYGRLGYSPMSSKIFYRASLPQE